MGKNDYHKLMNRSEKSVERRLKKELNKRDKGPIDERIELLEDRILELEAENERLKNGKRISDPYSYQIQAGIVEPGAMPQYVPIQQEARRDRPQPVRQDRHNPFAGIDPTGTAGAFAGIDTRGGRR